MHEHAVRPQPGTDPTPIVSGRRADRHGQASEPAEASAVVISKVQPPLQQRPLVERPRLLGWLDQHIRQRVVVVAAEAGYGKSALLADFSRRSGAVCIWYRLESSDRDWMTFLGYLVAAVRQQHVGFGDSTEALLRHVASMGPTREVVVATFLSDLEQLGGSETVFILDDAHLVEGSSDVAYVLSRLFEQAPDGVHFILAGRNRPEVPLGRLAAQGHLAELSTRDLRFTRSEIEEFFSAQGQDLRRETCDVVEQRTEGWVASLQLVAASIASSPPDQVDSFIKALSGARGSLYDFLAEEVLTRLGPITQRVLIHASLLDRIKPDLVAAALATTAGPLNARDVEACLRDVESVGLLTHGQEPSDGVRIHPLLRQFLDRQLRESATESEIQEMHVAIATAAEGSDWLVSGRHFAAGGHPDAAMRVIGGAASQALGSGAWGAAAEIIDSIPSANPPPAVQVIRARALTSDGDPEAALATLSTIEPDDPDMRVLISVARTAALHASGDGDQMLTEVRALGDANHPSPVLTQLGRAWKSIGEACAGGPIRAARRESEKLVALVEGENLGHFSAIAQHNAATAALAMGDYEAAASWSLRAQAALSHSQADATLEPSAILTHCIAASELNRIEDALATAERATEGVRAPTDALAEAAYLHAVTGNHKEAGLLVRRIEQAVLEGTAPVGSRWQLALAGIATHLARGEFPEAGSRLADLGSSATEDLDGSARYSFLSAMLSVLSESNDVPGKVRQAFEAIDRQQAWRWEHRVRLLEAASSGDTQSFRRWMKEGGKASSLALLETADVVGGALHLLDPVPSELERSIARFPNRWRPILARQLGTAGSDSSHVAAQLLADYGTMADVQLLDAYGRSSTRRRRSVASQRLVHRLSPTLRIRDLGRTSYEVAGHERPSSEARRKAASLLLFLVTRPKQTATREQVMEELWPSLDPASARNSLHQTLHFVRRDIAPWVKEVASADYVPLDAETIYLHPDLVQVDSVAFDRQASEILRSGTVASEGPPLLRLYGGRFAPEFEYDDWSQDWRAHVHATFLHLAHCTSKELLEQGDEGLAIEVLRLVAGVDPLAYDLRSTLIRTLASVGASDSARAQYQNLASVLRADLGIQARPYEDVLKGGSAAGD